MTTFDKPQKDSMRHHLSIALFCTKNIPPTLQNLRTLFEQIKPDPYLRFSQDRIAHSITTLLSALESVDTLLLDLKQLDDLLKSMRPSKPKPSTEPKPQP